MTTLRFSFRRLWQSPASTIAIVASLALGIGANAAMFALLNALLFRSIGVATPDRLIRIAAMDDAGVDRGLSSAMVEALRGGEAFDGVCRVLTPLAVVETDGAVAARPAHAVSGECLSALGVRPALGRLLEPNDDRAGADPVVVLSHRMWVRDFGSQTAVIGKTIALDGRPATVVGVTDAAFSGVLLGFHPDVVYPIARLEARAGAALPAQVLARVRDGDDLARAAARLQALWPRALAASVPASPSAQVRAEYLQRRLEVTPAATGLDFSLRRRFTDPLLVLVALSGFVLAIACVNAANLLLARGRQRAGELALRVALGAGRWRVVRDQLAEIAWLLAAGLAVGYVTGWLAARGVVAFLAGTYEGLQLDVSPDVRVLLVTGAIGALVLLVFGAIPIWRALSVDPRDALGSGTRTTPGRRWGSAALVTSQMAMAFALVAGGTVCALAIGGLRERTGVDPDRVLTVQLMPRPAAGETRRADHVYRADLMARVGGLPGVAGVAMATNAPLFAATQYTTVADGSDSQAHRAEMLAVSERFVEVLHLATVAGRALAATDTADSAAVAMISESLALDVFGTRAVVGRHLRVGRGETLRDLTVVGVIGDAVVGPMRARNVRIVYTSIWQSPPVHAPSLLVRVHGDSTATATAVSREIQRLGREYPTRLRSLAAERDAGLLQEYLLAGLSAAFALLGLMVAAIGVYGLLSVAVATRRLEIGIRMALGAGRTDIARTILGWAFALTAAGVLLGVPLVWLVGRMLRRLLPLADTSSIGPSIAAAIVLMAAGVCAAWLPMRRANGVRPADCLRAQ